jgi:phosphoribosyl-ATP pyrophosphohydrolase/phosphoribosyl-AMP cyclohydrolase/histidinol dehydrogenase
MTLLRVIQPDSVSRELKPVVRSEVLDQARVILDRVQREGLDAIRAYAERFNERKAGEPLVLDRAAMREAYDALDPVDRAALERAAERIQRFAEAQRNAIQPLTMAVPGGQAGHTIEPVRSAGCYAPAGRYPLPSSVLMTAITARAAGCERVVVASPGANPVTLAAAHIAGADEFLCVGGAHAIAGMTYGFENFERCDVIAGPGNAWVTAAKQLVSGIVGIDMLAGPSELLIIADDSADVGTLAADLLAQAEHDTDAVPILVTSCASHAELIQAELDRQLATLPTADTARVALGNGFVVVCESIDQAIEISDTLAPEHLEIITRDAEEIASRVRNAGGIFIGSRTAEVLGDYGIGPNHTLPTGGTARFQSGLSVMHFLRLRTWIRIDDPVACEPVLDDTMRIARTEGLIAHERSAMRRALD